MTDGIEARFVNDDTLLYNKSFVVEMAILTQRKPEEVKTCVAKIFKAEIEEPLDFPANREERYQRALALVTAIGRAVGEKLYDNEFGGEYEPYYRVFWQGMHMALKTVDVIGSAREKLFYEAGQASMNIVCNSVKPDKKREAQDVFQRTIAAFAEGVEACLA
jgi:hypothetical protein